MRVIPAQAGIFFTGRMMSKLMKEVARATTKLNHPITQSLITV